MSSLPNEFNSYKDIVINPGQDWKFSVNAAGDELTIAGGHVFKIKKREELGARAKPMAPAKHKITLTGSGVTTDDVLIARIVIKSEETDAELGSNFIQSGAEIPFVLNLPAGSDQDAVRTALKTAVDNYTAQGKWTAPNIHVKAISATQYEASNESFTFEIKFYRKDGTRLDPSFPQTATVDTIGTLGLNTPHLLKASIRLQNEGNLYAYAEKAGVQKVLDVADGDIGYTSFTIIERNMEHVMTNVLYVHPDVLADVVTGADAATRDFTKLTVDAGLDALNGDSVNADNTVDAVLASFCLL